MSQEILLNVNGRVHHLNIDPNTPLIYALRNDLGLMAAKFACGLEQCGACKVIIDGQAVPSCRLPVRSAQGREITTLEGLGTRGNLHPLQQAFIEEQAIQCGFCVPGMIISAKILLDRNPHPTDEEIKAEMSDNLCRCGVYDRMRRAIKRAAEISENPSSWKKDFQRKPDTPVTDATENRTDPLSGTLAFTPGLDSWIRINRDETITVFTGKVELGQHGNFLAVIAEREEQAVQAMRKLQQTAEWNSDSNLPSQGSLFDSMRRQPHEAYLLADRMTVKDPPPEIDPPANAAKTLKASYYRPYQMHASLGPSAAVAQLINGQLTVWSHAQGPFPLRSAIAHVLGMERDDVRVIHMGGPGCYGHNGADDAALDAALLARANPGYPVSVKWMRDDENAWEPYGPSMIMDVQASLSKEGHIIDWNYDVWSSLASGRPRPDREGGSGLLASWHLEKPFKQLSPPPQKAPRSGSSRNADPLYRLPKKRIVNHLLPDSPLRASSLRGLGAYGNIFAIESFMDELARAANADPVEFRLRHLTDERARTVIKKAAKMADWESGINTKGLGRGPGLDRGTGLGFLRYKNNASYVAAIVELRVNRSAGKIFLEKGIIACDAGQIVNPDGVANQLEGAFLQSASWTLNEQVNYDEQGITSLDWRSYPILRFRDAPKIDIALINRPDQPYMGVGEGAMAPISAAIANAVYDAVGVRLRHIPFTPDKVKEALLKNDLTRQHD